MGELSHSESLRTMCKAPEVAGACDASELSTEALLKRLRKASTSASSSACNCCTPRHHRASRDMKAARAVPSWGRTCRTHLWARAQTRRQSPTDVFAGQELNARVAVGERLSAPPNCAKTHIQLRGTSPTLPSCHHHHPQQGGPGLMQPNPHADGTKRSPAGWTISHRGGRPGTGASGCISTLPCRHADGTKKVFKSAPGEPEQRRISLLMVTLSSASRRTQSRSNNMKNTGPHRPPRAREGCADKSIVTTDSAFS